MLSDNVIMLLANCYLISHCYLCQQGYVFIFVGRVTWVVGEFLMKLFDGRNVSLASNQSILVLIRIVIWIQEIFNGIFFY